MGNTIEVGIGFATGRPNVCKLINSYYKHMLKQIEGLNIRINIFILYDLKYQLTKRTDFYGIIPDVYKNINVIYITPEDIEEEKKRLVSRHPLTKEEVDLILGHGHAKGRNTIMHYAVKEKMDYLLFWDDDEYPIAVTKDENNILQWKKQNNILKHIENMKQADITIGHHCGYISPIPYIDLEKQIEEKDFKDFIESISNDIINWETIKQRFKKDNGVTYAQEEILNNGTYEIAFDGVGKWIAGSTLCINLNHLEKIPAFYNPQGARGEDTFFSTNLKETVVKRIPVYHFHDGFLKYTSIMNEKYPKILRKISTDENSIEKRFLQASIGWIKYKPLLMYISDKKGYNDKIKVIKEKLKTSIPKIDELFDNMDFYEIIDALNEADRSVEKNYQEFIKTNETWDKIKKIKW